jgi:Fur family transcriptional regulator, stress-responsive regulator
MMEPKVLKSRARGKSSPETLLERLRRRQWRLTAQRRAIAEVLQGEHVHLTADQIYERATARLPEISRASVYNTLNELRDIGEILEITIDTGAKRYDPNTGEHHQHLVCDRCGSTWDVRPRGEHGLSVPEAERNGFAVREVQVIFRGLCAKCAARDPRG